MAGKDNLVVPTSEQAREWGRKGGSRSTPRKKLAARLTALKKKGLTNEDAKRLHQMMTEPDILDLDILMGLQSLKKAGDGKSKNQTYALLLKLSEKLHGTNKVSTQVNIQNNTQINVPFAELEEAYNKYS